MKHFYSHLISMEELTIELDTLELSSGEKLHLAKLADTNLHHNIIDVILDELDEPNKKLFIEHLQKQNHDKIWQILNTHVKDAQGKIKKTAQQIKKDLRQDIQEAKKRV